MTETRKKAIAAVVARRRAIQAEYDRLLAEPASYGITGSVSATNQKLSDLRAEITALDAKLATLLQSGGHVAGMVIALPDYRHWPGDGYA